mmetsp:Transcript_30063/g.89354  ORF Transcript_30063/g.89354 Transcript_30063/m.89354 type:complete len:304 (+) Transcript_30063:321-1232(+)
MVTGLATFCSRSILRIWAVASKPFMTGMSQSISITSNSCAPSASELTTAPTASRPSIATETRWPMCSSSCLQTSTLKSLSSTSSTLNLGSGDCGLRADGGRAGSSSPLVAIGSVSSSETDVPTASSEERASVPPSRTTSWREMYKPSPAPGMPGDEPVGVRGELGARSDMEERPEMSRDERRLVKLLRPMERPHSKTASCMSPAMPMPVSETSIRTPHASSLRETWLAVSRTSPAAVNLMAFHSRLSRTCESRVGSECTLTPSNAGSISQMKRRPFSLARWRNTSTDSRTVGSSSKWHGSSES